MNRIEVTYLSFSSSDDVQTKYLCTKTYIGTTLKYGIRDDRTLIIRGWVKDLGSDNEVAAYAAWEHVEIVRGVDQFGNKPRDEK